MKNKTIVKLLGELVNDCNYLHTKNEDIGIEARIDVAEAAIREIVRGWIPEEKGHLCFLDHEGKEHRTLQGWLNYGHNACRQAMIKRFK